MSLKLAARLVVLSPSKILDLQENDTTIHHEDLSSVVPPGTKALLLRADRLSGTGNFLQMPASHATFTNLVSGSTLTICPIKNQTLSWKNSVANDDWDVHLAGYFVQKRTR